MKTRMERILGKVTFVVILLALAAMINYYFWQNRSLKSSVPVATQTTPAENAWGTVPETVKTVQSQNGPVIIRDKGASFKMVPRTTSNQASAFLPESAVRAMQKSK